MEATRLSHTWRMDQQGAWVAWVAKCTDPSHIAGPPEMVHSVPAQVAAADSGTWSRARQREGCFAV